MSAGTFCCARPKPSMRTVSLNNSFVHSVCSLIFSRSMLHRLPYSQKVMPVTLLLPNHICSAVQPQMALNTKHKQPISSAISSSAGPLFRPWSHSVCCIHIRQLAQLVATIDSLIHHIVGLGLGYGRAHCPSSRGMSSGKPLVSAHEAI